MTVLGRTKKIIVLTVLFVLLVALLVFAVIGLRNIGEDKTAVYRDAGATVKVTFVANGGTINGGGSYYRMVKPGDLVLEPGKELSDGHRNCRCRFDRAYIGILESRHCPRGRDG